MANLPKARLDMGHGFMKCIIKNQVERDNYDKEVKAKLTDKCRGNPSKTKKPEIQTYVPPSRSKMKPGAEKAPWFDLEYEDNFGDIHRVTVNKGDELEALAQSFGQDVGLSETLIQALYIKLHEEVEKRSNGRVL